jgi:CheY-like chemotaxis protein/cell division septation protein DedD
MISRLSKRLALAGVAALMGLGLSVGPVFAQSADANFRDGVRAFEEGRYEDAEKKFTEVLKANPSAEEALAMREEAGYKFLVEAMAKGGRVATLVKRLLARAEVASLKERQDEDKMREMIRTMLSTDSYIEQYTLQEKLVTQHGHYSVPLLVEVMGDGREQEKRVRAITYLKRLGDEAVLAVLELLDSDAVLLQQNAAIVLGMIRDRRAIPALQRTVDKATDVELKKVASEALGRMGWSGSASEAYVRLAEAYFKEYSLVMQNGYKEWVVWKWRGSRLTRKVVARYSWNEQVAEELLFDGLGADPENRVLWAQLLNNTAQQITEVESSIDTMRQMQDRGQEIDSDLMTALEGDKSRLRKARSLLASAGRDTLFDALKKSLEDNNAAVAVVLIEALEEVNIDGSSLGSGDAKIDPINNTGGLPGLADDSLVSSTIVPEGGKAAPAPAKKPEAAKPAPKAETKPAETKPAETKPAETKPAETKPAETKPAETKPEPKNRPKVSQAPVLGPRRVGYAMLGGVFAQAAPAAGGGSGGALSAALVYGDKRVRFAAAMALARINPAADFANSGKVVENLSEAVSQSGPRVFLVVEPEQNLRNEVVGKLRDLGYMAYAVESGNDALVRLKSFPAHDMVIVSSELNKDGAGDEPLEFQFVRDLKSDYRTKTIKVMILTPSARAADMQQLVDAEETVVGVTTPGEDKIVLRDKVVAVFSSEEAQRDEKARADRIAEEAGLAIASLQNKPTLFKIESCTEALLRNCTNRPDKVRIAAMKGLAAIGGKARAQALPTLLQVFKSKEESAAEVRVAAADAIGECIKRSEAQGDVYQSLKAAAGEEDTTIWKAALRALGKSNLTGAQRLSIWQEQRLADAASAPAEGG